MRCKKVAIYGDNSSMKEIIGEAGLPADPNDINEIIGHMEEISSNKTFRKELEQIAFEKSLQFTTEKMVKETIEEYQKILNTN